MSAKSKAKGFSASSFLDLKAEISKHQDNTATSQSSSFLSKPAKKPTVWARTNKGVQGRAKRDAIELEAVAQPTIDAALATLARKSKIYEKLMKGQTGGLSEAQIDMLLVDVQNKDHYESDSDDVDESLTVPSRPGEDDLDDPIVEYEDEFGRIRTARRSQVPRMHRDAEEYEDPDEDLVIRNPENHFPVYEPNFERVAEIEQAFSETANPLGTHYDASKENRAKGAAFYSFSGDEQTRQAQMDELMTARKETEAARKDLGAVDVRPGEVEGMKAEESSSKNKAAEKRKRDLEERQRMVEAKRRKMKGEPEVAPAKGMGSSSPEPLSRMATKQQSGKETPTAPDPFAALERTSDPFATLERATSSATKKMVPRSSEADDFLASLEQDLFRKKTPR